VLSRRVKAAMMRAAHTWSKCEMEHHCLIAPIASKGIVNVFSFETPFAVLLPCLSLKNGFWFVRV
jgi:hypothetical protein